MLGVAELSLSLSDTVVTLTLLNCSDCVPLMLAREDRYPDLYVSYGDMEVKVPAFFADQIRNFMKAGRKHILDGSENRYLLVTPSSKANQAIDEGHFSHLIKSCNKRVSNKPIGAQLMRDMAVTALMEKPDLTEAESKSWAAAMQHSVTA